MALNSLADPKGKGEVNDIGPDERHSKKYEQDRHRFHSSHSAQNYSKHEPTPGRGKDAYAVKGSTATLPSSVGQGSKSSHSTPSDSGQYYVEDRKGDSQNLTYASLHRYAIPRHRNAGFRRVIGLDRNYFTSSSVEQSGTFIDNVQVDGDERKRIAPLLTTDVDRIGPPLEISRSEALPRNNSLTMQEDFVTLQSNDRRKRRRLDGQLGSETSPNNERAAKSTEDPDVSSDSEQEDNPQDAFDRFRLDEVQQKSVELSRAVHDRPDDIETWMSLVNHQEAAFGNDEAGLKVAMKRGLTEVKISVYETAISKNRQHPQVDRLVMGLMDEATKVWDAKRLATQWKTFLQDHPRSAALWTRYLDFTQSNVLSFTYRQCLSAYDKVLRLANSQSLDEDSASVRVYVLLRLTIFMTESGFSEHAIALWQAMLEFNLFRPAGLSTEQALVSVEAFWDTEVARIGELGASGWNSGTNPEVAQMHELVELEVKPPNVFKTWADCEGFRSKEATRPARTFDEIAEDDPYRVIIFSDIKDYLSDVTTGENDQFLLIEGLLTFYNLPPLQNLGTDHHQGWRNDPFLRRKEDEASFSGAASLEDLVRMQAFGLSHFAVDTTNLFADSHHWYSCWEAEPGEIVEPDLRRRTLHQLVEVLPSNELLAEYVLAFELQYYGKEARKYAKGLLKKRSTSLRLYNAYAMIELRLKGLEAAERVWSTALSMRTHLNQTEQKNAMLIWRSWIWELLDLDNSRKIMAVLVSMIGTGPDQGPETEMLAGVSTAEAKYAGTQTQKAKLDEKAYSPGLLLMVRRCLEEGLSHSISTRDGEMTVAHADLLAFLAYLSSSEDKLQAALRVYADLIDYSRDPHIAETAASRKQERSRLGRLLHKGTLELLHQSRARLLRIHSRHYPYRPRDISSILQNSLQLFHTNTIFLSLHRHYGGHLTDRIRDALSPQATGPGVVEDSIVQPAFEVWTELSRPSYNGSTEHSIRAAFESAIEVGTVGAHSIAIWKWYLSWELRVPAKAGKTVEPLARAQDIFYRGLRALPWAKEWHMLAFTEEKLRKAIGFDGLRKIYESMVEKELRVHVDLTDVLDEYGRMQKEERALTRD